jgi:flagellar hook-associated protein 3 FlgL
MSTRITGAMVARSVLSDLTAASTRLARTQEKLASGKEITRPSDDPFAAGRAMTLRGELDGVHQHQRTVGDAIGWEDAADSALGNMTDIVHRARELALQGSTDSTDASGREAIAAEVDKLIEGLKQEANASYGGSYIFAGTATDTRPYAVDGGDAFAGNTATIAREIGPGVAVAINADASSVLGEGGDDGKLISTLRGIASRLRSGSPADLAALRTTGLSALEGHLDGLLDLRGAVGATTNRLESANSRLGDLEDATVKLLSNTEDADMAKTMVDFSMQQSVYQSALRAGASIVQPSLLDFLR